jgi:hypothetical protein
MDGLEDADMEYILNSSFLWELQAICKVTNAFQDLKWACIPCAELVPCSWQEGLHWIGGVHKAKPSHSPRTLVIDGEHRSTSWQRIELAGGAHALH